MQKRSTRIAAVRRAAIAGAASTALIAGMIAPAGAQPADNPVMPEIPDAPASASESLPQLPGSGPAPEVPDAPETPEVPDVPEIPEIPLLATGERVQVGDNAVGRWGITAHESALYKQVTVGQETYPGDPVVVRPPPSAPWAPASPQPATKRPSHPVLPDRGDGGVVSSGACARIERERPTRSHEDHEQSF